MKSKIIVLVFSALLSGCAHLKWQDGFKRGSEAAEQYLTSKDKLKDRYAAGFIDGVMIAQTNHGFILNIKSIPQPEETGNK